MVWRSTPLTCCPSLTLTCCPTCCARRSPPTGEKVHPLFLDLPSRMELDERKVLSGRSVTRSESGWTKFPKRRSSHCSGMSSKSGWAEFPKRRTSYCRFNIVCMAHFFLSLYCVHIWIYLFVNLCVCVGAALIRLQYQRMQQLRALVRPRVSRYRNRIHNSFVYILGLSI